MGKDFALDLRGDLRTALIPGSSSLGWDVGEDLAPGDLRGDLRWTLGLPGGLGDGVLVRAPLPLGVRLWGDAAAAAALARCGDDRFQILSSPAVVHKCGV
jgi:hypothetical protein